MQRKGSIYLKVLQGVSQNMIIDRIERRPEDFHDIWNNFWLSFANHDTLEM